MTNLVLDRFMEKVMVDTNSGCWLWAGNISPQGYGRISGFREPQAHRLAYNLYIGPIPNGLDLDHKCRVRCCVNPSHLEPVTRAENLRRGIGASLLKKKFAGLTHCRAGHEINQENSVLIPRKNKTPMRRCRICARITGAKYDAKRHQPKVRINA